LTFNSIQGNPTTRKITVGLSFPLGWPNLKKGLNYKGKLNFHRRLKQEHCKNTKRKINTDSLTAETQRSQRKFYTPSPSWERLGEGG
jgi:hypothetical protein